MLPVRVIRLKDILRRAERRISMSKTLVIILGPHAVGKMTVGQELAKITDLHLYVCV